MLLMSDKIINWVVSGSDSMVLAKHCCPAQSLERIVWASGLGW
jgi:hypothetical protein